MEFSYWIHDNVSYRVQPFKISHIIQAAQQFKIKNADEINSFTVLLGQKLDCRIVLGVCLCDKHMTSI